MRFWAVAEELRRVVARGVAGGYAAWGHAAYKWER